MSRVFFRSELETVAFYWRIDRTDGVSLGFTSHDRDLEFDGLRFRAAPGMLPSAIRRTATLEPDNAEVHGALSHDAVRSDDLAAGRFDGARVQIGIVDWESLDRSSLYHGDLGSVSFEGSYFEAELLSVKAELERDTVPRTSPTCRARFCGPGCNLSSNKFTHEASVAHIDSSTGKVIFTGSYSTENMRDGFVRWIDGPHIGKEMDVLEAADDVLLLGEEISPQVKEGMRAFLREGCDHTLTTCERRFANSVNFQGEPFLPGNDALIRYPTSST